MTGKIFNKRTLTRKEFCTTLNEVLGKEDYEWLIQWIAKNKEKEAEEAEKREETILASDLRQISPEDYLFSFLGDPEIAKKLKIKSKINTPEEIERFSDIIIRLKLRKIWVDGTLV